MSSILPRPSEERRIIPLHPRAESPFTFPSAERPARASRDRAHAARHYLKFMLPSIPVAAFILTFMLCYVLVSSSSGSLAAAHQDRSAVVDPALPFLGALLLGLTTGALCVWIYFGYQRVSGAAADGDDHHHDAS